MAFTVPDKFDDKERVVYVMGATASLHSVSMRIQDLVAQDKLDPKMALTILEEVLMVVGVEIVGNGPEEGLKFIPKLANLIDKKP